MCLNYNLSSERLSKGRSLAGDIGVETRGIEDRAIEKAIRAKNKLSGRNADGVGTLSAPSTFMLAEGSGTPSGLSAAR